MSYAATYPKCIYPDTKRVLGVELAAFTVGHGLLLWRIESPFCAGGKVGAGHLVTAAYALSRRCGVAAADLNDRRTKRLLKWWGRQVRWCCRDAYLRAVTKELQEFIDSSFLGPTLWEGQGGGKCQAPYLQTIKVALQARLGCSREAALNYPVREAIWDLACHAEMEGHANWVSDEESAAIRKALAN